MQVTCCAFHFTGKERDTESGLDYFGARYYCSSMGAFHEPRSWLDSPSALITAERNRQNARQALTALALRIPGEDVALSVVTVLELMHGAMRANSPERQAQRRRFIDGIFAALPVHPVPVPVALHAGKLDGEYAAAGNRLALADLLIGVTALGLGYGVLTGNVRHFERIAALQVVRL